MEENDRKSAKKVRKHRNIKISQVVGDALGALASQETAQKNNSEVVTTKKSNFSNTRPKSLLTPPKKSHSHFSFKNGREMGNKIKIN